MGMTIDGAIAHAREVAKRRMTEYENHYDRDAHYYPMQCKKCAEEHIQLAEWLEELKQYRAIGTAEECRAAAEKQKAKMIEVRKAKNEDIESELRDFITPKGKIVRCPTCRSCLAFEIKFCFECGQKLDWGDEE